MKIKSIMAVAMLLLSSLMSCEEDNSNVTYSPNDESKMTELPDSMWNKINSQDTVLNACSEKINGLVASQNESNDKIAEIQINPAKRNVLDLKNETCKNREKRNVLKKSHTRHFKAIKKQSKTGCFYSF